MNLSKKNLPKPLATSIQRPECGEHGFITDHILGETICCSCGLIVHESKIEQAPEWRAYSTNEKKMKTRVGPPSFWIFHDKGLTTTFDPHHDAIGHRLPIHEQLKMIRLQKWNQRLHQHERDNLSQAMNEITRLTDALHLPYTLQEHAALLYRKAYRQTLIRGRSIKSMAAGSVYAACRLTQTPNRLKNVAKISPCEHKEIAKSYRLIHRYLNLQTPLDDSYLYRTNRVKIKS